MHGEFGDLSQLQRFIHPFQPPCYVTTHAKGSASTIAVNAMKEKMILIGMALKFLRTALYTQEQERNRLVYILSPIVFPNPILIVLYSIQRGNADAKHFHDARVHPN
jgi:hypothetical protein